MIRSFTPNEVLYLIGAARWTIALSLVAFIGGSGLGLIVMLCRVSGSRALLTLSTVYIEFFQCTPLLSQLLVMYFGFGLFRVDVNPWVAASCALILNSSAFLGEIWRGCIQSIPRAQWEAGSSLCLNFLQQVRYIILPQAIRIAIPPTVGFSVQVIKSTSLASVIGFVELTRGAQILNAATFRPFLVYFVVGVIYFAICYPLTSLSRRLESRIDVPR
jgi:polar amino acid transport system permease protein